MPLPSTGSISIGQIKTELGIASDAANVPLAGSSTPLTSSVFGKGGQLGIVNTSAPHSLSEFRGYTAIPTNGLVLYLNAAVPSSYAGSGTLWNDISGNAQNGVLTNGPTFTSENGGGISFDGSNDYVTGGAGSAYGVSNAITIIAWAKAPDLNQRITLFEKYQYPTSPYGYAFEMGTISGLWTRTIRFWAQRDGTYSTDYRGTIQLSNNTVYMVTAVYEPAASIMKMYYNLTEMTATQANPNWFDNANFGGSTSAYSIGGYGPPENIFGACTVYSLMLYNRVLSFSEITQAYNAQKGRFGL